MNKPSRFFNQWVHTELAVGYILGDNVVPQSAMRETPDGQEYSNNAIICEAGHVLTVEQAAIALGSGVMRVLVWEWCENDGTDPDKPVVEFLGEEIES